MSAANHSSTTRTASAGALRERAFGPALPPSSVVSPQSGNRYTLGSFVGEGGFARVYRVTQVGGRQTAARLCLKISTDQECWIREAYFAQMLQDEPRALRVFDAFVHPAEGGTLLYCLISEFARHGDLQRYLGTRRRGLSETRARRQMIAVLGVLDTLHRGHALHRDLTPFNVFVCDGETLKLGDFGIARHQRDRRGVTANVFSRINAPHSVVAGAVGRWQTRDDVFQVGQLLAMLIRGDARERVTTADVSRLSCSDGLKEIIQRCIGRRHKRFETAADLIDALRKPPQQIGHARVRSLRGERVVFTGRLALPRHEAARAARAAGAHVDSGVSTRTTVVVRGQPNAGQAAGAIGLKLMEVKRLRQRGAHIKVISEKQFWKLVNGKRSRGGISPVMMP